ncbi:hypothetical protein GCM10009840_03610 [Pseudolysinimonas kribbensis]|uniref:DUF3644 domain-containing protein n=1 Tax=Pseudolysinimonas kribbensis TaxID=433641 RepID=A0ABQ6K3Y9_9MICO|nr:hypothetical protein GCM10025881_14960 [Pseudolysinimonas kribbensis]
MPKTIVIGTAESRGDTDAVRMRRQAAMYLESAIESLVLAIELFNRPSPIARDHAVPMLLGHSFEMLLKSIIFQARRTVRDRGDELTYSLARCIGIAADDLQIISKDERALIAALKQDRDCATHDSISMSEQLLWVHMRSGISVIRRLLRDELQLDLTDLLPGRVIPVSTEPPHELHALVEDELATIAALLAPGTRKGPEARARLRPLLSLDGAATGRVDPPTEAEVARAEAALRARTEWTRVLPGLATLSVTPVAPDGDAQEVILRVGRGAEAIPVRKARRDEEALAYRSMDPFEEYGGRLREFGSRLGITQQQGYALIEHLAIKDDDAAYFCRKTKNGNVQYQGLSARAYDLGRKAIAAGVDLDAITARYNVAHARRAPGAR